MDRLKDTPANHSGNEESKHLAQVGGEQELDRFTDIAVYLPPFFNSHYNGREVVIGKHHV
ncbi:hypothetical protein D3C73_1490740 [compost metagenome]